MLTAIKVAITIQTHFIAFFVFWLYRKLIYRTDSKCYNVIPSAINHWTHISKFRLQNFASPKPYLDKAWIPACFSLEISKSAFIQALTGDGIILAYGFTQ